MAHQSSSIVIRMSQSTLCPPVCVPVAFPSFVVRLSLHLPLAVLQETTVSRDLHSGRSLLWLVPSSVDLFIPTLKVLVPSSALRLLRSFLVFLGSYLSSTQ